MGNCIGEIYPFDDCDSCQEHCCDVCSKKLLMMGSALSKYEKRLDDEEAAREDGDTKLQENLDAETARAKEAEANLDAKINKEIQDRIDDVNAEENRATQAEAQLRTDLNDEIDRATNKENELDAAINKEVEDRKAAIAELEQTTADNLEKAKQELQTNIDNEVNRAKATEETLQSNIDKEVEDRIADVDAEETRAIEAEKVLQSNIDAEEARATEAEQLLTTNLNSEITRAKAAEEKLTTDLNAEVSRATAKETEIEANLNKEIQDRTKADSILQTNIENGTIVANKAANDSDGNPINTTYVKVEGFKTNYLDSNNVMYKDDIQVLNTANSENKPLPGLNIKGVNYNTVSAGITSNASTPVYMMSTSKFPDSYTTWSSYGSFGKCSLLITGEFGKDIPEAVNITQSTIMDPSFTMGPNLGRIETSILIGNITSHCKFTYDGAPSLNQTSIEHSIILSPIFNAENDKTSFLGGNIDSSVYLATFYNPSGADADDTIITNLDSSVVIGHLSSTANTNWDRNIVIGASSFTAENNSIAIGYLALAYRSGDVVIGNQCSSSIKTEVDNVGLNTVIGTYTRVKDNVYQAIVLGSQTWGLDKFGAAMFIDGRDVTRTFVISDLSHILFRNGDITDSTISINDFPNRKTLLDYFNEKADNVDLENKVDKTTTINGHALSSNITLTKSDIDLGNVVNTGDSATPISGGTTKFTTGGAYTMQQTLQGSIDSKQDALTAGDGISITDNTISCTVSSPVTATDVVIDLQ